MERGEKMNQVKLYEKARALPLLPGIYMMRDDLGNIIYIGKSKALKQRVSSYFNGSKKPNKVVRMVRHIVDFEVHYTDTELEALLLECRLIKHYQPIYNRLLKKDHKYRYFYLNPQDKRPRIRLVREKERAGQYFGPYEKGQNLYEAVTLLNTYYQLPDCRMSEIKENCLSYKRERCLGPCKKPYDEDQLEKRLEEAAAYLRGENQLILEAYERKMQEAAMQLDFETAGQFKKEWQLLQSLQHRREALNWAKSYPLMVFKLKRPSGGEKLFVAAAYRILWAQRSLEKGNKPDEVVLKKMVLQIEDQYQKIKAHQTEAIRKADMDEIYIMAGYLKGRTKKEELDYIETLEAPWESLKLKEVLQKAYLA